MALLANITNKDQDWLWNADNIIKQVDPEVYMVSPANRYALYQIGMNDAKKESTQNPIYHAQHDVLEARLLVLTNADKYAGGAPTTTYTSDPNGVGMFQVGARWRNMTKWQNLIVTQIVGNAITLATEDGANVTAADSGDTFKYIFFPHEEGGVIRNPQMTQVTQPKNAITIIAEPWGITAQMEKTLTYTGPEFARQHQVAIERHKNEAERLLWFSTYNELFGPTGERLYESSGVFEMATVHNGTYTVTDLENPTTGWNLFDAWLKDNVFFTGVVGHSSDSYTVLHDDAFAHSLAVLAQGNPRFILNERFNGKFNVTLREWESFYGMVKFVRAPILNGSLGVAVAMDDTLFKCRQLQPTYLMSNIEQPRAMRKEAALVSSFGPQYAVPESLSVWRGI